MDCDLLHTKFKAGYMSTQINKWEVRQAVGDVWTVVYDGIDTFHTLSNKITRFLNLKFHTFKFHKPPEHG